MVKKERMDNTKNILYIENVTENGRKEQNVISTIKWSVLVVTLSRFLALIWDTVG